MSIVIPSLNYGTVVGRFLVELGDSTDDDNRPDVLPAKGFVTFTPSISYATVQDSEPDPAVLFPQKVIGVLDSDGYLSTAQYDALNNKYFQTVDGQYIPSRRGVSLQATDDYSLNPYDWTWRADFSLRYPGATVTFPGFDFRLPSEYTLDLVQAIPIETSAGEFSLIGPRGETGPRGPEGPKGEAGEAGDGIESITESDGIIRVKWDGGSDVTIPVPSATLATSSNDGLMPSEDKAKLDNFGVRTYHPNANEMMEPGVYDIVGASQSIGLPGKYNGVLTIQGQSNYLIQQYYSWIASGSLEVWVRALRGGVWGEWQSVKWDGHRNISASGQDLNDITLPGAYGVLSTTKNTPENVSGVLEVLPSYGATSQRYTTNGTARVYIRVLLGSSWSEWKNLTPEIPKSPVEIQPDTVVTYGESRPDAWMYPEGTSIYWTGPKGVDHVSAMYRGDGYVGEYASAGGYSNMQLEVVGSNGDVNISCINPNTFRHVSFRLQGIDNASYLDDMQLVEEIWAGPVNAGVPSMDILMSQRSNMEFAFQIDIDGDRKWVPYHGIETAFDTGGTRGLFYMDGTKVNPQNLPVGTVISNLEGLKMRQSIYGRHPESGDKNWVRVDQITTFSPDGMMQSETVWTALEDLTIGSNYAPMTPMSPHLSKMQVMGGKEYNFSIGESTTYVTIDEGRNTESFLVTDPNSNQFVAVAYLDPETTLLRNNPLADTLELRVEQRAHTSANLLKVYPSGFERGIVIPKGTVWRFGAQWRYGEDQS